MIATELHVATLLVLFSCTAIGTRVGLDELSEVLGLYSWQHGGSFPSLLANCVGCLLLGFLSASRARLFDAARLQPLYTALSVGFCGTLTTFSAWLYDSSWVLCNRSDARPSLLPHVVDSIGILCLGLVFPCASFLLGKDLAFLASLDLSTDEDSPNGDDDEEKEHDGLLVELIRGTAESTPIAAVVVLAMACVPVAVCLGVVEEGRALCLAMLLGPLGALLRWQLSVHLNQLLPDFPVGTFVANVAGTLLYALMAVVMGLVVEGGLLTPLPHANEGLQRDVGWLFLTFVLTGFCGALTTMSTFVSELFSLSVGARYRYLLVSVLPCYFCLLLINGLYFWMADRPSVVPL